MSHDLTPTTGDQEFAPDWQIGYPYVGDYSTADLGGLLFYPERRVNTSAQHDDDPDFITWIVTIHNVDGSTEEWEVDIPADSYATRVNLD